MSTPANESSRPILVPDRLAVTIAFVLLGAASVSWIVSYYLAPFMMRSSSDMMAETGVAGIVSSLSLPSVGLFEIVWTVGMVAMMFPAMIPVILFYNRVKTKLEPNLMLARVAGTPVFLAGYLATYALLGIGAYLAVYVAVSLSSTLPMPSLLFLIAPSAVLILAGFYQFSPLKNRCLSQCVSPFGFFATHSSKGLSGAFRMGFSHGSYCVGCCWAYMLVMLAVGAMSIPAMAALAGVIALEKVIVRGSTWFKRIVAFGLISIGILLLLFPNAIF